MKKFFGNFDLFGQRGVQGRTDASSGANKDLSAKGQCREWGRSIKREIRKLDRDVDDMTRNEKKTIAEVKALAAKKEFGSVKILAKELVYLRKSRDRLLLTKTQLNSVSNQLTQQMAMGKLGSAFQQSADIMASMNALVNVPEITQIMTQMGKEMQNMGLIESIMADGIDQALGDNLETEAQTDQEISKLLEELAIDAMTLVPSAGKEAFKNQRVAVAKTQAGAVNAGDGL